MTAAQKAAMQNLWPAYGLDSQVPFRAEAAFQRNAPLIVEIGFGNGCNLAENADQNPDINYLGIEVHEPGIGHLMKALADRQIRNVRIFRGDATEILRNLVEDESIDRINLFFPDPWPKKRHQKRRLVSPEFVELINRKLKTGGCFHAATDWQDYANQIARNLTACGNLNEISNTRAGLKRRAERCMTRFEERGIALGHPVRDILFEKHGPDTTRT